MRENRIRLMSVWSAVPRGARYAALLLALFAPVHAQPAQAEPAVIDRTYAVPDQSGAAAALLERLRLAAATPSSSDAPSASDALASGDAVAGLSAAERAVAAAPGDRAAIARLAVESLRQGRADDAAALAFRLQATAPSPHARAGGLALMAEALLAQGRVRDAVNLYALAVRADGGNPRTRARLAALTERFDFRVRELSLDVERDRAAACFLFTGNLKRPLPIRPEDYVTVRPAKGGGAADVDVAATGDRLCVRGLRHGESYTLTVRAGLPSARGPVLARADVRTVRIADRTRRLMLGAGRYVLPRRGENVVPLKSVNVDGARLALYRLVERDLVSALRDDMFGSQMSGWDADRLVESHGRRLWQGRVDIAARRNREVTTLVSLNAMLKRQPVGVYALMARDAAGSDDDAQWQTQATQWIVVSDIGLMSLTGADGLTVIARSLETALPLSGTRLTLLARNNDILGTAVTNASGVARFPAGLTRGEAGDAPMLVTAAAGADFNLLRLQGSALDLTDRGIDGRTAPAGAIDAFLYTERGVYRPGESVKLSVLMRDAAARALPALPFQVQVLRPDGREYARYKTTADALGGGFVTIPLPPGVQAGQWTARVLVDPARATSVGETGFRVEDFVPQRIELAARAATKTLAPGQAMTLAVAARYFYGAPAGGLGGEAGIEVVADPEPYPAFKGWSFGRVEEGFEPTTQAPVRFATGPDGTAALRLDPGALPDSSRPLQARAGVTLFDVGGRPVYVQARARVLARPVDIALKARFGTSVGAGEDAVFDVAALRAADGRPLAGRRLSVQWVEEQWDYSWYQEYGSWSSRTSVTDKVLATATLATDRTGRALLRRRLESGRYRLDVADADGTAISSWRFYAGWWSSGEVANAPDALELNLEKADLKAGDTLRARVKAPFDGTATIAVLSNRVHWLGTARVSRAGSTIAVPVQDNWGPGAYLAVTGFRPGAGTVSALPVRAMGLAWFSINVAARTLRVDLKTPAAVEPRQTIRLPVQVTGATGDSVRLTIAAVDEGILALTGFKTPRPETYYFAKRQLGLDVRDLYGQIILPANGARGRLREGGDGSLANAVGVTVRTVKTVALFDRTVRVDGAGRGTLNLTLPDFAGRLRLMAVAYGRDAVGSGEAALTVRDPVVSDLILPRFLTPGDRADATLSLHNTTSRPIRLTPALTGTRGLAFSLPGGGLSLKPGERRDLPVPLGATSAGAQSLTLRLAPGGRPIERRFDIMIRPPGPVSTRRSLHPLKPGQALTLDPSLLRGFLAGTASASLTVSARPDFDAPALIKALDQYPYGCSEQTLSTALPLLYLGDVATAYGVAANRAALDQRIDRAILTVLSRQTGSGAIGLWSSADADDPWLSAYAYDALTRMAKAGHYVPGAAYGALRQYLAGLLNDPERGDVPARAYALYALARTGHAGGSDVRYFAQTSGGALKTRLAAAQVAAALAIVGEPQRAQVAFARAAQTVRPADYWRDYGSPTRDGAASLALMLESGVGGTGQRMAAADAIERVWGGRPELASTQDAAWLLLATHALATGTDTGVHLRLPGGATYGPAKGAYYRRLDATALLNRASLTNLSKGPVRAITSVRGAPLAPLPAGASGFQVSRRLFSLSGQPADAGTARQNDRFVVLIQGVVAAEGLGYPLIADLLPAGFEIENAAIGAEDVQGRLGWLPPLSPTRFTAARDDRFVAALGSSENDGTIPAGSRFAVAYVVRAITPGSFIYPGVSVEDMYRPVYFARGAATRVTVSRR